MVVPDKGLVAELALPLLQLEVDLPDVLVEGPLVVEVLPAGLATDPGLVTDLLTLVDRPTKSKLQYCDLR
jgi:hypothetical protein